MSDREFNLLLRCLRPDPDNESIRALISDGIEWDTLLRHAAQHSVRPLLLRTLESACWCVVPEEIQLSLLEFGRANGTRNLVFTAELLRLFNLFDQAEIPAITFKGPVLTQLLYGNFALREFSDLDIVVREADVSKAEDILSNSGYQAVVPDPDYRSAFLHYQGQYAFRHPTSGILVDLHWQLWSKGIAFPLQADDLWSKLKQVSIAGRLIPTLNDDDLTLFLASHGTKESWRDLIWLCDFAQLLRNCHDIDWEAVFYRAQSAHIVRPLLLAVFLASSILKAPVPTELIDKAARIPAVRSLAAIAEAGMTRSASSGEVSELLNSIKVYDNWRHRFWPVLSLLTTRTVGDYQAMPLPKPLWPMYYLTRPFRLATKIMAGIAR